MRPFREWAENSAVLFLSELDNAYRRLAAEIDDELFPIYRDDQSPGLAPTAFDRGLFPVSVVPRTGEDKPVCRPQAHAGRLRIPDHQRLRQPRAQNELPVSALPVDPQSVRYDIRLYDGGGRELARADGLSEPLYRVAEPLSPCTLYRWTVRARFPLDGREWVTDWSGGPCP